MKEGYKQYSQRNAENPKPGVTQESPRNKVDDKVLYETSWSSDVIKKTKRNSMYQRNLFVLYVLLLVTVSIVASICFCVLGTIWRALLALTSLFLRTTLRVYYLSFSNVKTLARWPSHLFSVRSFHYFGIGNKTISQTCFWCSYPELSLSHSLN